MNVERQKGKVFFMCDACEEPSESDYSFYEMKDEAMEDGWLIIKDKDTNEWSHLCPQCSDSLPEIKG